jgi:hypothetical protein
MLGSQERVAWTDIQELRVRKESLGKTAGLVAGVDGPIIVVAAVSVVLYLFVTLITSNTGND